MKKEPPDREGGGVVGGGEGQLVQGPEAGGRGGETEVGRAQSS